MPASCAPDCPRHHCHAWRCRVHVPPAMLMCRPHWYMVPRALRDAVWATYRPGQERDKKPSRAYMTAAIAAINAVAERERQVAMENWGQQRQLDMDLDKEAAHGR